jgi:hypothetical protein
MTASGSTGRGGIAPVWKHPSLILARSQTSRAKCLPIQLSKNPSCAKTRKNPKIFGSFLLHSDSQHSALGTSGLTPRASTVLTIFQFPDLSNLGRDRPLSPAIPSSLYYVSWHREVHASGSYRALVRAPFQNPSMRLPNRPWPASLRRDCCTPGRNRV